MVTVYWHVPVLVVVPGCAALSVAVWTTVVVPIGNCQLILG